jgi:hypothetical protein
VRAFLHQAFPSYVGSAMEPRNADEKGWVQLFCEDLIARGRAQTWQDRDAFKAAPSQQRPWSGSTRSETAHD